MCEIKIPSDAKLWNTYIYIYICMDIDILFSKICIINYFCKI